MDLVTPTNHQAAMAALSLPVKLTRDQIVRLCLGANMSGMLAAIITTSPGLTGEHILTAAFNIDMLRAIAECNAYHDAKNGK